MIAFGLILVNLAMLGVILDIIFDFDMPVINLITGTGLTGAALFLLGLFSNAS